MASFKHKASANIPTAYGDDHEIIDLSDTDQAAGLSGRIRLGHAAAAPVDMVTATGKVTASGTPANGNTVTINGRVYTFKTTLTPANDEILINGQDGSLTNLENALNDTGGGTPDTDYSIATANADVTAGDVASHGILLTAVAVGAAGNAVTLVKTGNNLGVSGAHLGTGTGATAGVDGTVGKHGDVIVASGTAYLCTADATIADTGKWKVIEGLVLGGNALTTADIDTDATMAANSDAKVPSQKATKTALATKLGTSANAASATKLATARAIFGKNFDGTAAVTGVASVDGIVLSDQSAPVDAVAATGTVGAGGTPADGNTVTVNGQAYTFKTTLTPVNYEVLINGQDGSLTNLEHAINGAGGTPDTDYKVPGANANVTAADVGSHAIVLTAIVAGVAGNALTLAKVGTNLTVNGGAGPTTLGSGIDGTVGSKGQVISASGQPYYCTAAATTATAGAWKKLTLASL